MRFGRCGCLLLAASILFGACVDQAYEVDPDSFLPGQDGSAQRRDAGPRPDGLPPSADRGVGSDVAVGNDRGLGADQGASDLCTAPTSCDVVFSYAKGSESSVELRGDFDNWAAGVPMTLQGGSWQATLKLAHGAKVLYKFVLDGSTWLTDPQNPQQESDNYGGYNSVLNVSCPSGCADAAAPTADSGVAADAGGTPTAFDWRDGVMYFVLLDRFENGDPTRDKKENTEWPADFQGGDLQGLINKIKANYFNDLGVNVLWISSPVDAPDGKYAGVDGHDYTGYHGYWPTDLTKVEERLGDLALLKTLVNEAHAKGLKIVMDYVMNHVHQKSPTYAQHASWFYDINFNNKNCVCGQGCSWDDPNENTRCWFMPYLPDFDFTQQSARDFSVANAIKWIQDTGVDGYRLDAVKHIDKSWITELRTKVSAALPGKSFYMVGETFSDQRNVIKDYVGPTMLDGQFDFPLRAVLVKTILMRQGTFYDLDGFLASNTGYYGPNAIMGTFLGNHDLPRSIHLAEDQPAFGDWDSGKARAWNNLPQQPSYDRPYQRLALAFTALLTLPGVPLIYYGDEVGLAGGGDPDNRRFMQWTNHSADQQTLKAHIAKLTKLRAAHPALRRGIRKQLFLTNDVYAYEMVSGSDRLIVVLNRSDSPQSLTIGGLYKDLLSGATVNGATLSIGARSSMVLQ